MCYNDQEKALNAVSHVGAPLQFPPVLLDN